MDIEIYVPSKEKTVTVGRFENGVYSRQFNTRHIMKVMGYAVGIQAEVIERLQELDCRAVHLFDGYNTYESKFSQWTSGKTKSRDFGHGLQYFLPLSQMTQRRLENGDE